MEPVELVQFLYSHYNEKVRWALDWKRVPHRRRSLLPGPHAATVKRLTGQTQVPVLRLGDQNVVGSARIIDELERRHPDPPLYPADPAERRRALEIQTYFDEEVGADIRRALFSTWIDDPDYLCLVFSCQRNALTRALYRRSFGLVKGRLSRGLGLDRQELIDQGFERTRQGFDRVAKEVGTDGYFVGQSFTVADLAAASILALAVHPEHPAMRRPEPLPDAMKGWLQRWSEHPGAAWVLRQYRTNRPPSAEID
jgi:glutathione S-transferase